MEHRETMESPEEMASQEERETMEWVESTFQPHHQGQMPAKSVRQELQDHQGSQDQRDHAARPVSREKPGALVRTTVQDHQDRRECAESLAPRERRDQPEIVGKCSTEHHQDPLDHPGRLDHVDYRVAKDMTENQGLEDSQEFVELSDLVETPGTPGFQDHKDRKESLATREPAITARIRLLQPLRLQRLHRIMPGRLQNPIHRQTDNIFGFIDFFLPDFLGF